MFQNETLKDDMKRQMKGEPFLLNQEQRSCVLNTIKEVCNYRGYELIAVNVRTNHLHAVVSVLGKPERIVRDFKTYGTRRLREKGLVQRDQKIWVRGKSARYLWEPKHVEIAVDYVNFRQGGKLPTFD